VTRWTAEAVQAAAADWTWVPPDATQLRTDEYQLVAYPEHYFTHPVCVLWSRSERPVGQLISEAAGHARVWGHTELYWDVSAATRPAATEAELLRRGATLAETEQVLGYDMTAGLPELGEPPGVRAEVVRDEAGARAGLLVNREVWGGGGEPAAADVERELADASSDLADWSGFRVVSFIDGGPAAFGGCTLVDGVARLWGAGTRPAFRGRGAYRAVLGHRMAVAREHGATLALVKGRVETSAPILRRAGFRGYGEERCYRLDPAGEVQR
jgi:GNAT superfamily N-acetyltransferase